MCWKKIKSLFTSPSSQPMSSKWMTVLEDGKKTLVNIENIASVCLQDAQVIVKMLDGSSALLSAKDVEEAEKVFANVTNVLANLSQATTAL